MKSRTLFGLSLASLIVGLGLAGSALAATDYTQGSEPLPTIIPTDNPESLFLSDLSKSSQDMSTVIRKDGTAVVEVDFQIANKTGKTMSDFNFTLPSNVKPTMLVAIQDQQIDCKYEKSGDQCYNTDDYRDSGQGGFTSDSIRHVIKPKQNGSTYNLALPYPVKTLRILYLKVIYTTADLTKKSGSKRSFSAETLKLDEMTDMARLTVVGETGITLENADQPTSSYAQRSGVSTGVPTSYIDELLEGLKADYKPDRSYPGLGSLLNQSSSLFRGESTANRKIEVGYEFGTTDGASKDKSLAAGETLKLEGGYSQESPVTNVVVRGQLWMYVGGLLLLWLIVRLIMAKRSKRKAAAPTSTSVPQ
jgi:hypothetical protein